MNSKKDFRSLATRQNDRRARFDRVFSWVTRILVAMAVVMTMGSFLYVATASDSDLHQTVDAIWRYFHYFGGARPTE